MGLRINTNVASLQAQNNLSKTSSSLRLSLERLSSGLRINKGSDDVVGLLTSESLRSQIRGIGVAQLDLSNAKSLLGVAEGSLAQLTDVAQRIREKVVQAADNTISSADRTNLTTSINDLLSEYSRLATASSFNNVALLDGTFTTKTFQIGPNNTDGLAVSITDSRSSSVGKVAVVTSITIANRSTSSANVQFTDPSGIVINSVTIATTAWTADGVSNLESSESAIAYVSAINSVSGQTKVSATILSNVVTLATYNGERDLSSGDKLYINGTLITQGDFTAGSTGAVSLVSNINDVTTTTGVSARNDTTASAIVLTASDGRNIDVKLTSVASNTGVLGLGNSSTSTSSFMAYRGTFKLYSDSAFTLSGATAYVTGKTAVALDTTTTLSGLKVDTADNASSGIFILDSVIRQLQNRRSDVGSKSIRFEVATSELNTRKENLSSAESTIRDTDVAAETANLTKNQILQQAGVTVLQRSNALPQIALTLLQG